MPKSFNAGGPIDPEFDYHIDPFTRVDWPQIRGLIDRRKYFVLHAPSQTGKTTLLEAMAGRLNAEGKYVAAILDVEGVQPAHDRIRDGELTIVGNLRNYAIRKIPDSWLALEALEYVAKSATGTLVLDVLTQWAMRSPKPIVLMIDEVDSMLGDTLLSVLRQLRTGHRFRPREFPHSIILCGVRNTGDYRIGKSDGTVVEGSDCFNVAVKITRLGNFSEPEVRELYGQHTAETGQIFEESVFPAVMQLTGGQPCLVNLLANELTEETGDLHDRSRNITLQQLHGARRSVVLAHGIHFMTMSKRLEETRVRNALAPILTGDDWDESVSYEDQRYLEDLGIVVCDDNGQVRIANEIYREVIPRLYTRNTQRRLVSRVP